MIKFKKNALIFAFPVLLLLFMLPFLIYNLVVYKEIKYLLLDNIFIFLFAAGWAIVLGIIQSAGLIKIKYQGIFMIIKYIGSFGLNIAWLLIYLSMGTVGGVSAKLAVIAIIYGLIILSLIPLFIFEYKFLYLAKKQIS